MPYVDGLIVAVTKKSSRFPPVEESGKCGASMALDYREGSPSVKVGKITSSRAASLSRVEVVAPGSPTVARPERQDQRQGDGGPRSVDVDPKIAASTARG